MKIKNLLTDKKIAIIQCRMGSNRLPGKVLANIGQSLSLDILISRIQKSKLINEIVLVTTEDEEDDILDTFCQVKDISIYRDNADVLKKVCRAADRFKADLIIDVTGDCPFIDPIEIDKLILKLYFSDCDYTSNIFPRNLPIGFDIQVYKKDILKKVEAITFDKAHRTHSGWNILNTWSPLDVNIKLKHNKIIKRFYHPDWRVVLDYMEDLILLNKIYNHFGHINFSQWDVMRLLEKNSDWLDINKNCRQKRPDEV